MHMLLATTTENLTLKALKLRKISFFFMVQVFNLQDWLERSVLIADYYVINLKSLD